jgi:hypothetical protein
VGAPADGHGFLNERVPVIGWTTWCAGRSALACELDELGVLVPECWSRIMPSERTRTSCFLVSRSPPPP